MSPSETSNAILSRRQFIVASGALSAAATLHCVSLAADSGATPPEVRVSDVRDKTLRFIESMRVTDGPYGRYHYAAGCRVPTLYSSTYAAMTRHLYGDLDSLTVSQRAEWVAYLQSHQDDDGMFRDPVIFDQGWYKGDPEWCGRRHLSCQVVTALTCLGAVAKNPMRDLERFIAPGGLVKWLESRDWGKQPDFVGNEVLNVGTLLQYARDFQKDERCQPVVADLLNWMKSHHMSEQTGLWGQLDVNDPRGLSRAVMGGYHFWLLYFYAEFQKQDTQHLYDKYWATFDTDKQFWRKEVRQGRLKRSRLDLFMNDFLTLATREEVSSALLFSTFREHVRKSDGQPAAEHMQRFRAYADVYRSFSNFPADSREGQFFYRLEQLDTTTVFPLLLEVLKRYGAPKERAELHQVLGDLESFFVRRAVCELTTKNYNRLFVDMIKAARAADDFSAMAVRKFLLAQTVDVSRWPSDEEFHSSWLQIGFYKRLKKAKARMILEALEASLHTGKTEKVQIERMLTIEHLLPKRWEKYWPLPESADSPGAIEDASKFRNEILHRVGNLTLLTKSLNPAISNGPWDKKRHKILEHSALNLNRCFQDITEWDEASIEKRSGELFKYAMKLWPRQL